MSVNVTNNYIVLNAEVFEGDTLNDVIIQFKDEAEDPYDISGLDFYYTVKRDIQDADSDAIINKAPGDATKTDSGAGTVDTLLFILSAAETEAIYPNTYHHAIKLVNGSVERTWVVGTLKVLQRRIDTV